jgi:5'-methylthioadenosine nucleosidase
MTELNNICILMAMAQEAQPLIKHYNLKLNQHGLAHNLPMQCYQGKVGALTVSLVIAGYDPRFNDEQGQFVNHIGSEAATLMAYAVIQKLKPDLMISAGTAGGFSAKGADVGTVYLSHKHFIYHDRHVPLTGYSESALGLYPTLNTSKMASALGLEQGVISTGSSLEKSDKDIAAIQQFDAVAKEMEAAAIAWIAQLFNLPFFAVKSITNLVDHDNQSEVEFVNNLEIAVDNLTSELIRVINYMQNKTLDEL